MTVGPLALLLAAQAAPVPPPVEQVTADCVHPVYATDMLVCGDPALRRLDDRLRTLLASAPPPAATSPLLEDSAAWFRRSRRCAFSEQHYACIEAAYAEAIAARGLPSRPAELLRGSRLRSTVQPARI